MPSNFLTPFLELDDEFCKNFRSLDMTEVAPPAGQKQRVAGFQRRHSLCPVTLPNSKFNTSSSAEPAVDSCLWPLGGIIGQQLPRSSLNQIPFRVDRSVSMIEGSLGVCSDTPAQILAPPPGLSLSNSSLTSLTSLGSLSSMCSSKSSSTSSTITTTNIVPPVSTRYKTELCRTYEESGTCKYGTKCQFAHGMEELRGLNRHPKYKTEPCRTFHTIGFCPYGARCHFIHNADEESIIKHHEKPRERPQLRQSVSFAGFSSQSLTGFQALPDPQAFSRAASVSPPPSTGSPDLLSPLFPDSGALKQGYGFSGDAVNEGLKFFAIGDSKSFAKVQPENVSSISSQQRGTSFTFTGLAALQRSSSADSLSDQEGYTSSSSSSGSLSGCESPSMEARRLPIFSRLSVSDD